jgi:hypothetical protein
MRRAVAGQRQQYARYRIAGLGVRLERGLQRPVQTVFRAGPGEQSHEALRQHVHEVVQGA